MEMLLVCPCSAHMFVASAAGFGTDCMEDLQVEMKMKKGL